MRRIRTWITLVLAAGIAVLGIAAAASANSISPSVPIITPLGGGIFDWSYTLIIDAQQLIPATNGSQPCTTTGTVGSATQCSFFTLFDVRGLTGSPSFTSAVLNLAGTVMTTATGPTAFNSSVPDSASLPNVDVAFTNNTGGNVTNTTLGTLDFMSTLNQSGFGFFSAQADLLSNGLANGNQGQVLLPVPEPASLALLGSGLLGLVGMAKWRHKTA